jgi:hypothetical protein
MAKRRDLNAVLACGLKDGLAVLGGEQLIINCECSYGHARRLLPDP